MGESSVEQYRRGISAQEYATRRHGATGELRQITGLPYITHPEGVVALVRTVPHTQAMLDAGWAHDTVENAGGTLEEIRYLFGPECAEYVGSLTKVSTRADGNRARRFAIDQAHLAKASPPAKTVKLADIIENAQTAWQLPPAFAELWLNEKVQQLEVLREGDPTLWELAHQTVHSSLQRLAERQQTFAVPRSG